jgi:arginase family enzyme
MVFLGQSADVWQSEWDWVQENGATIISADVVSDVGIDEAVRQALQIAGRGTESIYVSIDTDAINVYESPGTMSGSTYWGINARDFARMFEFLGRSDSVGAIDIMEMTPEFDPHHSTAFLISRSLVGMLHERAAADKVRRQGGGPSP